MSPGFSVHSHTDQWTCNPVTGPYPRSGNGLREMKDVFLVGRDNITDLGSLSLPLFL